MSFRGVGSAGSGKGDGGGQEETKTVLPSQQLEPRPPFSTQPNNSIAFKKGFFSILDADALPPGALQKAVTAAGVAEFGAPVDLEATRGLKVDLLGAPPPRCRAPSPPCLFAAALPLSPRLLSPLPSPLSHSAPASPSPAPPLHLDIKKNSRRLQLCLAQRRALGQGRGLC